MRVSGSRSALLAPVKRGPADRASVLCKTLGTSKTGYERVCAVSALGALRVRATRASHNESPLATPPPNGTHAPAIGQGLAHEF